MTPKSWKLGKRSGRRERSIASVSEKQTAELFKFIFWVYGTACHVPHQSMPYIEKGHCGIHKPRIP
jgi:hypothetical protein